MNINTRNNIKIKGKGENVILFAHGYGCDQNMWRFIIPAFEENYKIVTFDHVGSGKSDWSSYNKNKYSDLKGYASDVVEICEKLNLDKVILVAHSVSAMIALLAAQKRPDLFTRIIMIGPSPKYINDNEYFGGFSEEDIMDMIDALDNNYLGWSSSITPVIMGNPDKPELTEELKNSFCQHDPEIAKHFARVTFLGDNRKDLPTLTTPTLIIQCSEDIIAPVKVGEYVYKSIPNSRMSMIEATGHCPHLSHPKQTIDIIKNYLNTNP